MPTCPFCGKEVPAGSSICPHCLRALPISVTTARATSAKSTPTVPRGLLRIALLLVLLAVGAYALRNFRTEPEAPPVEETVTGPVTTTVAPPLEVRIADSAAVPIPAGGHLAFAFSGDGRSGCRIRGAVRALSGGDRRIDAFIVDRDGLADVESGKTPRTYYDSGETSDVALDVNLDGRTEYTLVVSNPSKSGRPKSVRIKAGASCSD